jgi:hypothetical protein
MSIERTVLAFAGFVVVASVLLSVYHNVNWLYLTGFVGINLFQSAFTGFCPLANILKMFGLKSEKAAA